MTLFLGWMLIIGLSFIIGLAFGLESRLPMWLGIGLWTLVYYIAAIKKRSTYNSRIKVGRNYIDTTVR